MEERRRDSSGVFKSNKACGQRRGLGEESVRICVCVCACVCVCSSVCVGVLLTVLAFALQLTDHATPP